MDDIYETLGDLARRLARLEEHLQGQLNGGEILSPGTEVLVSRNSLFRPVPARIIGYSIVRDEYRVWYTDEEGGEENIHRTQVEKA